MPWSPKQEHVLQARAHGWKGGKPFANVGESKARELLDEGKSRKSKAQRRAFSGGGKY